MLNRNVIRTVLNSTEVSSLLQRPGGTGQVIALQTTDALYLGYHGKFAARYFEVDVVNAVAATLSVKYWDGTDWTAVDDLIDQTSSGGAPFAQNGFLSWINKTNWAPKNITGTDADLELYWVKIETSANLTAGTKIHCVLNLFSDDTLLSAYYPELVSDSRYKPSGETDFLDQHIAAKDLVVLRLKQRKLIDHEYQIIDPNDVAIAAVHACAWMILNPIATSADTQDLRDEAKARFEDEIGRVSFHIDQDEDGTISPAESKQNLSVWVARR